jgi:sigma-54 dependent transcriptional regulator, acetoin dehydrogenase operon transcriptional activator AcoR
MDDGRLAARLSGPTESAGLAPRVRASWQRSREYGVSLETVEPVFTGTYDDESLFFQCGREVLGELYRSLANEPVSLMLTDVEGLVLNRFSGDHGLLRALDAVHLAPGFAYSEREAGTNGLGLALADRMPTVVRAEEHYSLSLCTYTCAAAPVLDPVTGRLEGSVNLTTWADSSSDLLLALAQSAASNTASLMLARSQGRSPRPAPRGEVFRLLGPQLEPGTGSVLALSAEWQQARTRLGDALGGGAVVAAVGEAGSGRTTVLAQAMRERWPRDRILATSTPGPADVDAWLDLWLPELGKPHTSVVVRNVDALPAWVAVRLRDRLRDLAATAGPGATVPLVITATSYDQVPGPLAAIVRTVVEVPPLRDRPEDVLPLARHAAHRFRGREVSLTAAAERALHDHGWPGNVAELVQVVRHAASVTDVIDVRHLPPELLSDAGHRLSRIEAFERAEIIRVLTRPGITMHEAAEELGMSRATVYRKIQQYGIRLR